VPAATTSASHTIRSAPKISLSPGPDRPAENPSTVTAPSRLDTKFTRSAGRSARGYHSTRLSTASAGGQSARMLTATPDR
jgi:hypothetical protein